MKMEQGDGAMMGSIKMLIEKRDEYRRDIARRARRRAHNDEVMIEIDKVLLGDIEWQLDHKKG